ncbi:MAG: hypothetical protein QOH35_1368 [Acidobacteriaceae bacterium]|jgi:hypothetical protein|nr:hypothetical protein [Acidobacteriaceae bacterium]MEA2262336.1 hypothetical protein [Acidobacteriaceae bacterium]MEA2540002.1 hypothetical protein [Acidobacteriaceae bacterium]
MGGTGMAASDDLFPTSGSSDARCRFANYLAHFCSNYVALQTAI